MRPVEIWFLTKLRLIMRKMAILPTFATSGADRGGSADSPEKK